MQRGQGTDILGDTYEAILFFANTYQAIHGAKIG
jgi:hypothetical protein